jgi:hypothetical protein
MREPGPLVTLVRSRTVANVDSIGLVVLKWILGETDDLAPVVDRNPQLVHPVGEDAFDAVLQ